MMPAQKLQWVGLVKRKEEQLPLNNKHTVNKVSLLIRLEDQLKRRPVVVVVHQVLMKMTLNL